MELSSAAMFLNSVLTTITLLASAVFLILAIVKVVNGQMSGAALLGRIVTIALILGFVFSIPKLSKFLAGITEGEQKSQIATTATATLAPTPEPVVTPAPNAAEMSAPPATPVDTGTPLAILLWLAVAIVAGIISVAIIWAAIILRRKMAAKDNERKVMEVEITRATDYWKSVIKRHEAIRSKILEAETDIDMLLKLPALTDISVEATSNLFRVLRDTENADQREPGGYADLESVPSVYELSKAEYPTAVQNLEHAWSKAYSNASRIGTKNLPESDRKAIKRIRQLLTRVSGAGLNEHERASAYGQIKKLLNGLQSITVPQQAMDAIEAQHRLAITA